MTVYIVYDKCEYGSYNEDHTNLMCGVLGVFSTKEKASHYIACFEDAEYFGIRIVETKLDKPHEELDALMWFHGRTCKE